MSSNSWWWWALAIVIVLGLVLFSVIDQQRDARLRATGQPATARVVSLRQTGTWVANNPQIEFQLEVQPSGAAPYALTFTTVVPQAHLAAVQPGATLRVRVDAKDPKRIVFDEPWSGSQ